MQSEQEIKSDTIIPPDLRQGEIHIWKLDWEEELSTDEKREWLSEDELERASRFYTEALSRRFIVNRTFVRGVLSQYLNRAPSEIRFQLGPHGKPAGFPRDDQRVINFNISHSGRLTIGAVCLDIETGVDCERIREVRDLDGLAKRFFHPDEYATLMMVAEEAKLESFFKLWTAKEAFIKATGEGLSRGLDSFVIRDGLTDRPFVQEVGRESKIVTDSCWSLSRPPAPAGWAAALAHNSRSPVQVLSFDWSQLKNKLY